MLLKQTPCNRYRSQSQTHRQFFQPRVNSSTTNPFLKILSNHRLCSLKSTWRPLRWRPMELLPSVDSQLLRLETARTKTNITKKKWLLIRAIWQPRKAILILKWSWPTTRMVGKLRKSRSCETWRARSFSILRIRAQGQSNKRRKILVLKLWLTGSNIQRQVDKIQTCK